MSEGQKVIHITWQGTAQPKKADCYYHKECFAEMPVTLPRGKQSEKKADEIPTRAICTLCGEPF